MRRESPSQPKRFGQRRTFALAAALVIILSQWLTGLDVARASEAYLDVDITHQVLSQVVDGQVTYSTHISTGSGEQYWRDGSWSVAETPRGWFSVYAKVPGWDEGPLGALYNALYFFEGYAIHGSNSVPNYPASHGCVRVTLDQADALYDAIGIGTPVFVHD